MQINTDRLSTAAAGEQQGKESLWLQSSSHARPFWPQDHRDKPLLRILFLTETFLHLCFAFLPWKLCVGINDERRGTHQGVADFTGGAGVQRSRVTDAPATLTPAVVIADALGGKR